MTGTSLALNRAMSKQTTIFRHPGRALVGAILLPALLGFNQAAGASAVTRPDQLIDATRQFLEGAVVEYLQSNRIAARHEVEVNRLDPRLRLAECDQPLVARLETPAQPVGRTTVRVSCEGSSPWSIFVPAQVRLFREVVVARRPLSRNGTLEQADVALVERDVSQLNQGYLTALDQAVGNRLNRSVQPDQILTPTAVAVAATVRKGDHVVISAQGSAINVRMPGEALSDGALGEQIRVKNQRSGRVIKARVIAPGQVEVAM